MHDGKNQSQAVDAGAPASDETKSTS
jgi:hypothetical protein